MERINLFFIISNCGFRTAFKNESVREPRYDCIPCCSIIIRTNHLSEPPLVLVSSDNRRSTVFVINLFVLLSLLVLLERGGSMMKYREL